jgi:hypothetical protein
MPDVDHTVTITYTPGNPATWVFSPDQVTCQNSGNIWLVPATGSNWTVVGASVTQPTGPSQFTTGTANDKFKIHNAHTSLGTYKYMVQIQITGSPSTIWSPDPQIINTNPDR